MLAMLVYQKIWNSYEPLILFLHTGLWSILEIKIVDGLFPTPVSLTVGGRDGWPMEMR